MGQGHDPGTQIADISRLHPLRAEVEAHHGRSGEGAGAGAGVGGTLPRRFVAIPTWCSIVN